MSKNNLNDGDLVSKLSMSNLQRQNLDASTKNSLSEVRQNFELSKANMNHKNRKKEEKNRKFKQIARYPEIKHDQNSDLTE